MFPFLKNCLLIIFIFQDVQVVANRSTFLDSLNCPGSNCSFSHKDAVHVQQHYAAKHLQDHVSMDVDDTHVLSHTNLPSTPLIQNTSTKSSRRFSPYPTASPHASNQVTENAISCNHSESIDTCKIFIVIFLYSIF